MQTRSIRKVIHFLLQVLKAIALFIRCFLQSFLSFLFFCSKILTRDLFHFQFQFLLQQQLSAGHLLWWFVKKKENIFFVSLCIHQLNGRCYWNKEDFKQTVWHLIFLFERQIKMSSKMNYVTLFGRHNYWALKWNM